MSIALPNGFEPLVTNNPAIDVWAPLYLRSVADCVQLGTLVRGPLCNSHNSAHGGVIAALADMAMGYAYAAAFRASHGALLGLLTSHIAVDYIEPAPNGTWLEFETRVVFAGKTRGVIECTATADGGVVARANSAFRPLRPRD